MLAIFKREMRSYFTTPIGYIFVGAFLLMSGYFFRMINLSGGYPVIDPVLSNMLIVFMVLIPVLTMRLLSEEKNLKTDQVLLTSPVSVWGIVGGKFSAAGAVYIITLLLTLPYMTVLEKHADPSWAQTICNYIGFILMGLSFVSIGMFISSLTENQAVSAVASFAILLILFLMDGMQASMPTSFLANLVGWLAITTRFTEFNLGVLSLEATVYYLSIIFMFIFLTAHVVSARRYK